ncbi:MAG: HAD family hydrolase [Dehalococcoidia bacterium]|nr:HAD family hydrolase [Dehalococcoidia bacterium]MDD5495013.1 HAD family hydrolase [Dehalococcoidia bacterium]
MLKAVLFDVDNTLIFFDEVKFIKAYIPLVARRFTDLMPADQFGEKLLAATMDMHLNDGSMTNRERFLNFFCRGIEQYRDEIWQRFEKFYDEEFDSLKDVVAVHNDNRSIFMALKERNLKIVIATNPIWPLNAQMIRLSWAGIADIGFDLVTHIDNMSFCKPQIGYYHGILRIIGEKPEDCLMVGDDPVNDVVVATIGMKTYLSVDSLDHVESPLELSKHMSGRDVGGIPPADFKGPLVKLSEAVDILSKK